MWTLKKQFTFEAAHRIEGHGGKCANLHGHSWVGWAVCESDALNDLGMVVDFGDIKRALKWCVERLDHSDLNQSCALPVLTCETLARWIYQQVKPHLPDLVAIIIEETRGNSCEYRP